jgi:DUF4097 and DUF4098 domain-containing protein YvlB
MPTFDTPQPVSATIELVSGGIHVIASARSDTIVEVRPRHPGNDLDVAAAAQTRVEYGDGKLIVKAAKRLQSLFSSRAGAVEVTVRLPSGSHVRGHSSDGDFRGEGQLGDCWFKTASGDVSLHEASSVKLTTMMGVIHVSKVAGDCAVTGSGEVRIGEIHGTGSVQNLNGDSWVGTVAGDISLNSAHGNISVERAGAAVSARTAFGAVLIGEVARGKVVLQSAYGDLEVGIRKGTAAWLNVKSNSGAVRSTLDQAEGPGNGGETAEIRARTYDGNIFIRRAGA